MYAYISVVSYKLKSSNNSIEKCTFLYFMCSVQEIRTWLLRKLCYTSYMSSIIILKNVGLYKQKMLNIRYLINNIYVFCVYTMGLYTVLWAMPAFNSHLINIFFKIVLHGIHISLQDLMIILSSIIWNNPEEHLVFQKCKTSDLLFKVVAKLMLRSASLSSIIFFVFI